MSSTIKVAPFPVGSCPCQSGRQTPELGECSEMNPELNGQVPQQHAAGVDRLLSLGISQGLMEKVTFAWALKGE